MTAIWRAISQPQRLSTARAMCIKAVRSAWSSRLKAMMLILTTMTITIAIVIALAIALASASAIAKTNRFYEKTKHNQRKT